MKKTLFISLLLTTFALAAEPATPVKETTTTKTATVAPAAKATTPAPAAKTATPAPAAKPVAVDSTKQAEAAPAAKPVAVDSTKQAEAAPVTDTTTVDTTANAEATPATETATVDSTAKATPAIETAAIDTAAKATTQKKKKAKKAPLITAGAFKFDMNSDFEIQAGKVLWASEKDTSKNNFEEWTGRANLSFFTQSENFDGKVALSVYPGDLIDNKTDENYTSKTEVIDVIELKEAWAWQRTKYFDFKLGRWENTSKNGDYFGGYVDGYLNGFKSTFASENMFQFGFTPTENLSIDLALISTGPYLNTGDLRFVAHFRELSSIEALDIDLALRTNIFDKVKDHNSDVRTNVSLKVNIPIIEDKLFLFGEVAMLGLGGDSTELYINDQNIIRERDVVVDWKMPVTGGLMLKNTAVDRIILEAEYISDRIDTKYQTNSKHVKDVLGAFYIEKDLTNRFTLSAGCHSFGSSKDWVINGNLIGRIN